MLTTPYTANELATLSDSEKFLVKYHRRGKVIGEESLGVVSAENLDQLATILATEVEKSHPTPLVILNTNQLQESFIFKRIRQQGKSGIRESIGYFPGRREIILEKQCQIWREMGVEIIIEFERFLEEKKLEAVKKGVMKPYQYMIEETAKKYPGTAAYVKEYGLQGDLRILMADPRSMIYYRLIGRDPIQMQNAHAYYERFHSLIGRIAYVSNQELYL